MFGCALRKPEISVSWFDTDGTLIETQFVGEDYDPTSHPLPEDTDQWHYTGWTVSQSGNVTVCTATRALKTKVVWMDWDDTVLNTCFFIDGEDEPSFDLPESDDRWIYTDWEETVGKNEISYTAERKPNEEYFHGNVFQIAVKDQNDEPIAVGSGFVFNEDGWFVTNHHVMKEGYFASAFFDIPDSDAGTKHTALNILGGVYYDAKKDIFIGKIENYSKIAEFYHDIPFTEEYAQGDVCYSVGYPNSSITIEINEGTVLEEYSNIYDKINGVYYILSDSYIAPGSSGGILVNQEFEVIGITSMGLYSDESHDVYISGGSVPSFAFLENLKDLDDSQIRSLSELFHSMTIE